MPTIHDKHTALPCSPSLVILSQVAIQQALRRAAAAVTLQGDGGSSGQAGREEDDVPEEPPPNRWAVTHTSHLPSLTGGRSIISHSAVNPAGRVVDHRQCMMTSMCAAPGRCAVDY
jgi:hypothetical protein